MQCRHCTILYYTVLYYIYTVLYYTVLYYTVLYYTRRLYCSVLYYTVLYFSMLYRTILYCTVMYVLYCNAMYVCMYIHNMNEAAKPKWWWSLIYEKKNDMNLGGVGMECQKMPQRFCFDIRLKSLVCETGPKTTKIKATIHTCQHCQHQLNWLPHG